jgi:hypothetical protein
MKEPEFEKVFTTKELMKIARVSNAVILAAIRRGQLKSTKVFDTHFSRGLHLIRPSDAYDWMKARGFKHIPETKEQFLATCWEEL